MFSVYARQTVLDAYLSAPPPNEKERDTSQSTILTISLPTGHSFQRAQVNSVRGLQHTKEVQYNEYDGNYDQRVYPTTGLWDARAYVPTEKAKKPKYYQNYY